MGPLPGPIIFGHEAAGVVESVGPGVRHLAVGDHVVLLCTALWYLLLLSTRRSLSVY